MNPSDNNSKSGLRLISRNNASLKQRNKASEIDTYSEETIYLSDEEEADAELAEAIEEYKRSKQS